MRVIGAGPAGTAAAIAAVSEGAAVDLFEKSRFPRHKVCGEFLSPGALGLLETLGVDWRALQPATIRGLRLCFPRRESHGRLPETAFGLSRYALDAALLQRAIGAGATLIRQPGEAAGGPAVIATGRHSAATKGRRLFAFKAHFQGPPSDTMELFFERDGAYVGVNAIEAGRTNVCGLAGEDVLSAHGFEIDSYLHSLPRVKDRLSACKREWNWIRTGPLVFESRLKYSTDFSKYYAGDSLSFIDPFTGSGILSALCTGILAGKAAARGNSGEEYYRTCNKLLAQPKAVAAMFRLSIECGAAAYLERFIPNRILFRWSRPQLPLSF
ncbi:MAG: hypothetical protein JNK48_28475 [Bryobacterales bacterium]|nr:hypothetical protein [Bryobacterales bacterium]